MTKHMSPDERSTQILTAARLCFMKKGYAATKMDEIASAAGLSKGGVYFHYSSKRDIFHALVRHEYDRMMALIEEIAGGEEDDLTTKLLHIGGMVTGAITHPERARMMIIVAEMSMRDKELRKEIIQLQQNYIDMVVQLLSRSRESGQVRADLDLEAVAFILKAIVDGFQASAVVGYPFELERVVQTAVSLVTYGLRAPER